MGFEILDIQTLYTSVIKNERLRKGSVKCGCRSVIDIYKIRSCENVTDYTYEEEKGNAKFYTVEEGWWIINFPSISPLNVLSNNHMCEHMLLFLSFDPIQS
jgi:hypothetical protein